MLLMPMGPRPILDAAARHDITLHPFCNGHGRQCRLLLAPEPRKGEVPFPVSLPVRHRKVCHHYFQAIIEWRRSSGLILGQMRAIRHSQ
jgi:hypothetical protein